MTILLAPLPIQSFRDSNGNPLAGGLLYTYQAGTSTLQSTYTDATGATPNTNPVVLNSRGEASVWLTSAQAFKLVLQDSYGVLIWSVDQVASAASSGANSDISSLTGLTTPLSIAQGGTGAATANAGADALGAFRRGTLLGTVAQTAGVPTGAVIETGANVNGTYTRFADGTQICTSNGLTTSCTTALGSLFRSDAIQFTFPAAFITSPSCTASAPSGNNLNGTFVGRYDTSGSISSTFYRPCALAAVAASSVDIQVVAVGRWF